MVATSGHILEYGRRKEGQRVGREEKGGKVRTAEKREEKVGKGGRGSEGAGEV